MVLPTTIAFNSAAGTGTSAANATFGIKNIAVPAMINLMSVFPPLQKAIEPCLAWLRVTQFGDDTCSRPDNLIRSLWGNEVKNAEPSHISNQRRRNRRSRGVCLKRFCRRFLLGRDMEWESSERTLDIHQDIQREGSELALERPVTEDRLVIRWSIEGFNRACRGCNSHSDAEERWHRLIFLERKRRAVVRYIETKMISGSPWWDADTSHPNGMKSDIHPAVRDSASSVQRSRCASPTSVS